MAINIKPFKGICYNQNLIADLSKVICPPYDVISEEEKELYYNKSPYNFIHILLARLQQNEKGFSDRYTKSAILFNEWLKNSIFQQDKKEHLYFYRQDFFYQNKEISRIGFIGLMEIADSRQVFPHENTHIQPKLDRFELLKKVRANLSPIFTIFSDTNNFIEKIFKQNFLQKKPDIALKDSDGVRHLVWRLSDAKIIDSIRKIMSKKNIFIADGHHRFEVAQMFRELMKKEDKDYSASKSYNFLLTYFTTLESDGICILPIHRLIKDSIFYELVKQHFRIKEVDSIFDLEEKIQHTSKAFCYGFYDGHKYLLIELRNKKDAVKYVEPIFKNLDIAILDYYILPKIFGVKKEQIFYTNSSQEAKECVDKKQCNSAFLTRAVKIKQIRNVALGGKRMPPKSTYFYPKLASGLVVHKFEE